MRDIFAIAAFGWILAIIFGFMVLCGEYEDRTTIENPGIVVEISEFSGKPTNFVSYTVAFGKYNKQGLYKRIKIADTRKKWNVGDTIIITKQ